MLSVANLWVVDRGGVPKKGTGTEREPQAGIRNWTIARSQFPVSRFHGRRFDYGRIAFFVGVAVRVVGQISLPQRRAEQLLDLALV